MQEARPGFRNSLVVLIPTVVFACGLAYEPIYHIIRGTLAWTIIPQDDFWYYYITAKHFALSGFSSFDGIVPTNGYHPLWMWCIALFSFITQGNNIATFILIEVAQILSAGVTAILVYRLFRTLYADVRWIYPLSLLTSLLLTVLVFLSMETVVAIPLYAAYFLYLYKALQSGNKRDLFLSGLFGSLLVLARLDTLLLILFGTVAIYLHRKQIVPYVIGLIPLALYFASNQIFFGNWLPVSAQAKMLSGGFHFNFRAIEAAATPRGSIYIILTVVGAFLAVRNFRRDAATLVRILLFVFPILFALVLALRLTWSSYMWYFYPYPIAAAAGLLEIRRIMSEKWRGVVDRVAISASALIVILAILNLYRDINGLTGHLNLVESQTRAQPNIYLHALGIKPFTDTHPGRYAMGDRAGLTAFITSQPILQTEGLAADQAMVDSIRVHADLLNVLRKYGVHYYIVSYPLAEFHEAAWHWDLVEPHDQQVQAWAPKMRGRYYAPEVFRYPAPVGAILTHEDSAHMWVTRILDISRAHEEGK